MSGALSNGLPNGNHNIDGPESPATPIDNSTTADIKIDVDVPSTDSDLRSEPVPMKVDEIEQVRDASTVPQLDTPVDAGEHHFIVVSWIPSDRSSLASIPIAPPKGTPPPANGDLLPEVKAAEALPNTDDDDDVKMEDVQSSNATVNGVNGVAHSSQEEASPIAIAPSATIPAVSSSATAVESLAASSPYSSNVSPNDDDDKPPPAKRARKLSDAEKASVANVSRFYYVRRPGRADPHLHHVIPSEDRNSTSSVTLTRPDSDEWHGVDIHTNTHGSSDTQYCAMAILLINRANTQETEGCGPLPQPS